MQIRVATDSDLDDVFAYVGDNVGGTPGIFPVTNFGPDPLRPHLAGTGDYSFTLETGDTGVADGTRYIGTLAAGVAHDFNNLLTVIQGFADIAYCRASPIGNYLADHGGMVATVPLGRVGPQILDQERQSADQS